MSREAFLMRVRQAAQTGRAYRVHHREIPAGTGYIGAGADLCAAMAAEVNAVGGVADLVDDWDAARDKLDALLRQHQVRSALCWQHPVLEQLGLAGILSAAGIRAHDFGSLATLDRIEQRELMLTADIGISSADYAIAETGTLLLCARPGQERVVTLLPPVHVAIIHHRQLVPDLLDAIGEINKLGPQSLPSNITLITGPSKTGDIELQLTTGVHGPGKWHVIIVRGSDERYSAV